MDRSICVRQHLVFDASAFRQPVKFNEHWGDMIATSCSRYLTCSAVAAFCWLLMPVDRTAQHCSSLGGM